MNVQNLIKQKLAWHEAVSGLKQSFQVKVTNALKLLLESKHLYQSFLIDDGSLLKEYEERVDNPQHTFAFQRDALKLLSGNWVATDNSKGIPLLDGASAAANKEIRFKVPDVKLFCRECDRIEAFNSISAEDFLQYASLRERFGSGDQTIQVFIMSFLCQSCKTVPEVFLVRRQGAKLTICGRAPMEVVDVPGVIPKVVQRFYSGAVVAHQSGQTLAGVFLLRSLIEQWARPQIPEAPSQADQVLEAYMNALPEDFKSRFPSLRSLYAELSADIHSASGSTELFDKATKEIVEHFEARRLFKL